ncbi:MAG: SMI1/KNR4 family protein [Deinococcus sp.]|uniref:SMI1/KNR4 family protein n=1 Tax=Deinococcus sp. TaxID=47478 RepID=UPI0026DACADC|nr:SMI1/KNR4 family protein [Deinococcus sp.]MDO4245247.1 SMI1/KNR4 family protein [Deinococcus sp.]
MSEISDVWERIETWYEARGASHLLNAGASADAIAEAETNMGLTFPAELKESLLRHDGTTWSGWAGGELLSLVRIADERGVWMELLEGGGFDDNADHNEESTRLQAGWWNPAWIPLHADGGGNGMVIDTAPASGGTLGQVLFMDHEVGPNEPEYDSLSAYLTAVAEGLEAEQFVIYDDAVVSVDDLDEEMEDAP